MRWLVCLLFTLHAAAAPRPLTPEETVRFGAVGRVVAEVPLGSGTGVLLRPGEVLTSAHLFFAGDVLKAPLRTYRFVYGRSVDITCAVTRAEKLRALDAALLQVDCLDGDLDGVGVDLAAVACSSGSGAATVVAFHRDIGAGWHKQIERCRYRRVDEQLVIAGCRAFSLTSGAPVVAFAHGEVQLVGVMRGLGMGADANGNPDWLARYAVVSAVPADAVQLACASP